MKHQKLSSIFLLLFFAVFSLSAQQVPLDNQVRQGKLPNGLTYYIRYNKLPNQRADFYIAQKVGSILEEENQRGLAHFLEHMAFNGTKNFPGLTLRDYLQTIGVKFGENLNAYTSIDETVYMIKNVPTTRPQIIDSCLLILHDWSGFISLEDAEIDKERGVIREEWRTRDNASNRMYEKILPKIYGNDRYGHRLPIGLPKVIDNFTYQELRDYYHKWYRPDLQGLIIVGDVDVDYVESKLKQTFADIPAPVNPAERIYFGVTDNKEPVISIASDPEATGTTLMVFNKHDAFPDAAKNTYDYLMISYVRMMVSSMINDRYQEIAQKEDAPFTMAAAEDESFFISKTKDAWSTYAGCKDGQILQTLAALVQESKRAREYGFTKTEYDRAKADFLKSLENAYNERDKEKNAMYVSEYVELFLNNEPATGIEFEYEFFTNLANNIPVEAINDYLKTIIKDDENTEIVLMMPQKDKEPTREELLSVYEKAKAEPVSAYQDKVVDTRLVKKLPKKGKVVAETKGPDDMYVTWKLSNGIEVQYKKTDFKENQILMRAVSLGGTSLLDEKDMPTIYLLSDLINLGGVGDFDKIDLSKALAGKMVSVSPAIGLRTEAFNGNCSPKDFETMMQLVYLYLTNPRADEKAFDAYMSRKRTEMQNYEANPRVAFSDSISKAIYNNHPRGKRITLDMLDRVDYNLALKMYRERFMNADNFTFTFVGNINPDSIKPIVEQYLGGLPNVTKKETFKDVHLNPRKGIYVNEFAQKMETPRSSVLVYYSGESPYTLESNIQMDMLQQILNIVYTENIREKESGTYGVGVYGDVERYPTPDYFVHINFDTNPTLVDKLLPIVSQEIDSIKNNGPSPSHFNKVKEFMLKKIKENKAENAYWMAVISELNFTGLNIDAGYETTLTNTTPEDIKKYAATIFAQGNKIEVIMNPQ